MPEGSAFPRMRWVGVAWLAVWVPTYAVTWGWSNFLLLCDVAVVLTCVGLWTGNRLLLSSQAVTSLLPNALWALDVAWRLFLGRHLIGGTEYMWDTQYALWIRLLSCFHIVWPVLLVWAVWQVGYDRRGFAVQSALAVVLVVISRFTDPAKNLNYAFVDPILKRSWGPAPVHMALILAVMIAVLFWPTHQFLMRFFSKPTGTNANS